MGLGIARGDAYDAKRKRQKRGPISLAIKHKNGGMREEDPNGNLFEENSKL